MPLACSYAVPEEFSERYIACLRQLDKNREWSQWPCAFVPNLDSQMLQCRRSDGRQFVPGVGGLCEFLFFNPDYRLPADFGECERGGGEIGMTYELDTFVCSVTVEPGPFYVRPNSQVLTPDIAQRLFDQCRQQGGHAEEALGKYPRCELRITAKRPDLRAKLFPVSPEAQDKPE